MEMGLQGFLCTYSLLDKTNGSFADDKCLALSLDTPSEKSSHTIPDCYQIKTSKDGTKAKLKPLEKDLIASGSVANYAIAVSQPYFALALLNKAGNLLI
jgi:hypothetical protein